MVTPEVSLNTVQITVVIPTYQRPELLLQRAVRSALQQTFASMEIIVVLDGPDPLTEAALARIHDERLHVLVLPQKSGANAARNAGVRAARGRWIALLDDDDEWFPTKLTDQCLAARSVPQGAPALVVSRWITRTPRGDTQNPARLPRAGEPFSEYMLARKRLTETTNGLPSSALMIPREWLLSIPFDERLQKHQDWDWLLKVAKSPEFQLVFTAEVGTVWYFSEARPSISRRPDWRGSLNWARERWRKDQMTASAFRGFLISHVAPAAYASRTGWRGLLTLGSQLAQAQATPLDVARFLAIWLLQEEKRAAVRIALTRLRRSTRRPVGRNPGQSAAQPTTPLKVLLVDPFASGHHISYAALVARGLQERGHQVTVAGPAELVSGVRQAVPQVLGQVVNIHPGGRNGFFAQKRLKQEWLSMKFMWSALNVAQLKRVDVVHWLYLDGFMIGLLGAFLSRSLPGVQRGTLHHVYFAPPFRAPSWRAALFHGSVLRGLAWRGLRMMVHAPLQAQALENSGFHAVDVLPYGVPVPSAGEVDRETLRAQWRQQLDFTPQDVVLLAFGGTRRDKGVDVAIRSLAELPEHYRLLIVGPAQDYDAEALENLTRKHGVQERVVWHLEFVPEEEMQAYFVSADQVVLPYQAQFSGQSGPLTIAAHLGIPVVASDIGVLAATVREYNLGSCFPAGDYLAMAQAVRHINTHPPRMNTAQFIADYAPERFIDLVLKSYRHQN